MHFHRHRFSKFLSGEGIEIGALHKPTEVPKGVRIRYADVLTRGQVAELYPGSTLPDFVIEKERMPTVASNSVDFVIANHVLEHVSDPIGALAEWHRVLRPGGYLLLSIPDKRYMFDRERSRTTLAHLIEDYQSSVEPRLRDRAHLEDWATYVEKIPVNSPEWHGWVEEQFRQGYSVHNHVWILEDIVELLLFCSQTLGIALELVDVRNTPPGDIEFVVVLQASAGRVSRLRNAMRFRWAQRRESMLSRLRTQPLLYGMARKVKSAFAL